MPWVARWSSACRIPSAPARTPAWRAEKPAAAFVRRSPTAARSAWPQPAGRLLARASAPGGRWPKRPAARRCARPGRTPPRQSVRHTPHRAAAKQGPRHRPPVVARQAATTGNQLAIKRRQHRRAREPHRPPCGPSAAKHVQWPGRWCRCHPTPAPAGARWAQRLLRSWRSNGVQFARATQKVAPSEP